MGARGTKLYKSGLIHTSYPGTQILQGRFSESLPDVFESHHRPDFPSILDAALDGCTTQTGIEFTNHSSADNLEKPPYTKG